MIRSSCRDKSARSDGGGGETGQSTPPQNRPLWHIDYFELKATGKQQIEEVSSDPLLSI